MWGSWVQIPPKALKMKTEITVDQLKKKLDKKEKFVLLDVRNQYELKYGEINDSKLIPVQEIEFRYPEIDKNKEIVCYCRTGGRSGRAAEFLRSKGFNALNLVGGILAWKKHDSSIIEY